MKIKLDENLPVALMQALRALGHDVDTVPEEHLSGEPDTSIWDATQRAARFLITQDLDFSDVRRLAPGTHHGLLLVRLVQPGRLALTQRVLAVFGAEDVEGWARCFVVASDHKVRVRRPPPVPPLTSPPPASP
jgi:predicted nuclease of predicted toxin-antitoxin system